ncbi:MAG: large subunit ribosomal protein [Methanofollis sp.]|nr:large subunit ribosomal protein [Methanofollis sp.]
MVVERRVAIPAGITAALTGFTLVVKGQKGELRREMRYPGVNVAVADGEVVIATDSSRKRVVAMVGTYAAHVGNMFEGVAKGYEYRMKVVYSHFPIQLKLKGEILEINNFLGEKQARYARILPGVRVTIGNDEVTLAGIDKELVGSTSAKIERATKVRKRDTRVFQDGIYIVEKA